MSLFHEALNLGTVEYFEAKVHPRFLNVNLITSNQALGAGIEERAQQMAGGVHTHQSVASVPVYSTGDRLSDCEAGRGSYNVQNFVSFLGSLDYFDAAQGACVAGYPATSRVEQGLVNLDPRPIRGNHLCSEILLVGLFPVELPRQADVTVELEDRKVVRIAPML